MAGVKIDFDLKDMDGLNRLLNPDYNKVGQMMDLAGGYTANMWEAAAYGVKLPGMTRSVTSPQLAQSIEHHLRGELEVVIAADPGALDKATGSTPARDMKPGLLGGSHAKRSADGSRYNIIPFKHKFTSLSDEAIMALAGNVKNFASQLGQRSKITPAGNYTWKTGIESGIRLSMESGPVTFRTVSDKSDPSSWWYPARAENPMVEAVWAAVKGDIESWIFDAWLEAFGLAHNAR